MGERLADAIYRLLLLAFPARFRRAFGAEMRTLFHEHRRAAGSRLALARLWLAAAVDATVHGFSERAADGANLARRTFISLHPSHVKSALSSTMKAFKQDLKYALRLLIRQPGVTAIAVITLALGIGANAAIFSAVDAVLLRPLPWPEPDRLVMIWEKRPREGVMNNSVAPADFVDWARSATSFSAMSGYDVVTADLTGEGEPVRLLAGAVSASFIEIFGVPSVAGRFFTREEETVGRHRVIVLGHQLWTERFGADRAIVGRKLTLNGIPHDVVGVLGPLDWPDKEVTLWMPLALEGGPQPPPRANHFLNVYARMKPGVSLEQARAEMHTIGERLSQQYPETNRRHGSHVVMLRDELVEPVRSGLLMLLAAVGFVLLIACVNVANLLLARAASRRREIAVRAALGAGRVRLAAQGLTESLMLGLAGGVAGLIVAQWSIAALPRLAPAGAPVLGLDRVTLDARVLGFALLLSIATGALFGILPAWQLARQDVNEGLRDGGRSITAGRRRLRTGLVIAEVALAALLLVGAGLALRSFRTIVSAESGIRPGSVMTALVTVRGIRYNEPGAQIAAINTIEANLAAIPGVRSVGGTSHLPLSGMDSRAGIAIQGYEAPADTPTRAHFRAVTSGYFQTLGIPIFRGRPFTPQDDGRAPLVAIINETAARQYWPNRSPLGGRVRLVGTEDWREVVGVVRDVRHWGLNAPINPELYMPIRQFPWSGMVFVVAGAGAESLAPEMRAAVRAVDADLVISRVRSMAQVQSQSVERPRVAMLLLAVFAAVALTLAAAGIYGVMSHLVTMRTSEIGIRMTLGARPRDVLRQILGEAVAHTAIGLGIGLVGAVALMRGFRAMLYEVSPADPMTLAGVAVVLVASAVLACYIPARRATRIDPVSALRAE